MIPQSSIAKLSSAVLLTLYGMATNATVTIDGVNGELKTNVAAHLTLNRELCNAPEWKIRRLHAQANDEIAKALEVYGYYSATITKKLEFEPECWNARFSIDPGQAVMLNSVSVEIQGPGKQDATFATFVEKNQLQIGQPLNHSRYESLKQGIENLASRRGYFDGVFVTNQIIVRPEQQTADIQLIYASGQRYRFGQVSIDQNAIDNELIEKYINFSPGMPYDSALVSRLYESLLISDYFDNLDIRTTPLKEPDHVVQITVYGTESRAKTFTSGIGFGTDTGPKFRAGYNNRRRNKKGHQSSASLSVSSVVSEVGLGYRLPLDNPRAEWLNFDTGYRYEDTDTSRSKQAKFGIKRLQLRSIDWLETQFIEVAYEDFTVGDTDGTSFLLIPGISWSQTVSTGPPRPWRGHRVNLQVSGTAEEIGSTVSFLQVDLFGKIIRRLWPSARLIARSEFGYTLTSNFENMPASKRYFAGGDFSVRGYDYKSIGPKDNSGDVIGGENLLAGSLELDQRIATKWSVAAFADAGNAFESFSAVDLKFSVGAGIRWYSPLGPIRFDVAVPLANDAPDSFRIHVTLGPDL